MSIRVLIALLAVCFVAAPLTASTAAPDLLEAGFTSPPDSARPHTWWHWMNGNISRQGITADLEAMKRIGLGGAQIFNVDCGIPTGPVRFMTPEWIDLVKHAVTEANRLGLELCIHNCAGWSSSGGPWIKPEAAMMEVVWTERKVTGPGHFSEALARPETREGYYHDIAVLAFRSENLPEKADQIKDVRGKAAYDRRDRLDPDLTTSVAGGAIPIGGQIDLTSNIGPDGRLTWDVPEGQWIILRVGYTPTGAVNAPAADDGRGLECDKLSREGIEAHWAAAMDPLLKALGPAAGRSLNNSLIDSYERGHQNWSRSFPDEFKKRRGYDIRPYLPVIAGRVVGSPEISERFLWDLRRTVADLWAENYVGRFTELCHQNGMQSSIEPYGNASFDDIQCGGQADIAMGEFWVGSGGGDHTKLAASAMHTYGGKFVGAESFTAVEERARWQADPYSVKALGDRIWCDGVNRFIFHRYAHQPWMSVSPGMTMGPWGTNFDRTNTWWNQGAAWISYLSRSQFLLQSGLFCADVCYFYGESGPNDLHGRRDLRPVLPEGYDYDACDSRVVLERMSVRDGRIVLPDGMSYSVLVLPDSRFMTPKMLAKVAELVRNGATVVGPKPAKSPSLAGYPECDSRLAELADQVWGDCDGASIKEHVYGQGRVVWGVDLGELLGQMNLKPDFSGKDKLGRNGLNWIHRRDGDADIYFLANPLYAQVTVDCTFRQSGRAPELWDPVSGKTTDAAVYSAADGTVSMPIRFDPAGSVFVVFRKPASRVHVESVARANGDDTEEATSAPQIIKAIYGPPGDAAHSADVTAIVAAMATAQSSISATNGALGGDPALNIAKQLTVEYTLDGKTYKQTVVENGQIDLPGGRGSLAVDHELEADDHGGVMLKAWKGGFYTLKTSDGGLRQLRAEPRPTVEIDGSWTLQFPEGWGAPRQVVLPELVSWTEHANPGVRYFSGTARYSRDFDLPAGMAQADVCVVLDLGKVKNLAEVTLNGRKLGVLWNEPFRVDVAGIVQPGRNHLEVEVTNLWPNRIIGDAQLPDEYQWRGNAIARVPEWVTKGLPQPKNGRYTFATWKTFGKDSKLLESGLLGPVVIYSTRKVQAL